VPEEPEILVEKRDGFAVVTLNRPGHRNALTASLLESLAAAVAALSGDASARCVVLRGSGGQAFSVGMDLTAMAVATPEENQRLIGAGGPLRTAISAIEEYPYPVIAMVEGYALGAACELAVSCDIRIGCGQSRMGMPPAKLGIVYPPEGLERFVGKFGVGITQRLFFTARHFEADELYAMGVLDFVCGEELEGFSLEMAREISSSAPLSQSGHKRILREIAAARARPLDPEVRAEIDKLVTRAMSSRDAQEGVAAFLDKRPPHFTGK
jgi:enoyl-CoA hydratase/carnithine racemase